MDDAVLACHTIFPRLRASRRRSEQTPPRAPAPAAGGAHSGTTYTHSGFAVPLPLFLSVISHSQPQGNMRRACPGCARAAHSHVCTCALVQRRSCSRQFATLRVSSSLPCRASKPAGAKDPTVHFCMHAIVFASKYNLLRALTRCSPFALHFAILRDQVRSASTHTLG